MKTNIAAFLLVLLAACSGSRNAAQMNTQIQQGAMPEGGMFAGVWFSNWGEMTIEVDGSSAVGQFCDEQNNRYGRLEGTVRGDVLRLHWYTNDVSMGNVPRTTDGTAIVQLSFTQQGENQGQHYEGTWGYNQSNADGGPLRADRSAHRSERFLRRQYTTPCAIREGAEGGPVMSTDEVEDNPDDDGGSLPESLLEQGDGGPPAEDVEDE
jgi:hypothetical protein